MAMVFMSTPRPYQILGLPWSIQYQKRSHHHFKSKVCGCLSSCVFHCESGKSIHELSESLDHFANSCSQLGPVGLRWRSHLGKYTMKEHFGTRGRHWEHEEGHDELSISLCQRTPLGNSIVPDLRSKYPTIVHHGLNGLGYGIHLTHSPFINRRN